MKMIGTGDYHYFINPIKCHVGGAFYKKVGEGEGEGDYLLI